MNIDLDKKKNSAEGKMLCNVIQDHLDNCDMIWRGKWGTLCLHEVNTN